MNNIVDVTAVRELNDQLRHSLRGGVLVMTAGVIALGQNRQLKILEALAKFDGFDDGNDPYGEHDFGAFEAEGDRLLFAIDYLFSLEARLGNLDLAGAVVLTAVIRVRLPRAP
jgi:hypothetical protein